MNNFLSEDKVHSWRKEWQKELNSQWFRLNNPFLSARWEGNVGKSSPAKKNTLIYFPPKYEKPAKDPAQQTGSHAPSDRARPTRWPAGFLDKQAPDIEARIRLNRSQQINWNCFTIVAQMSLSRYSLKKHKDSGRSGSFEKSNYGREHRVTPENQNEVFTR